VTKLDLLMCSPVTAVQLSIALTYGVVCGARLPDGENIHVNREHKKMPLRNPRQYTLKLQVIKGKKAK
jgi:hypothetical protein